MAGPVLTASDRSPDGDRHLLRDTRVRRTLEKAGAAHDLRPVAFEAVEQPATLAFNAGTAA